MLEPEPAWEMPWYGHLASLGRAVLAATEVSGAGFIAAALNDAGASSLPVHFVSQARLPQGEAYERFIARTHQVPTRDNWHDFFNGLIWLHLPHAKMRLNAIQAAEIERLGIGGRRGAVRDAATIFDENAVLLHVPDVLWDALCERRWSDLFIRLRPLWQQAQVLLFGHAALEKLLSPYKSITAHAWRVGLPLFDAQGGLHALDGWLARDLRPEKLARKPFAALPLLGIPGWWPANADAGFYADPDVFRPRAVVRTA